MEVIKTHSPDWALWSGMKILEQRGIKRDSRNGPVYVMPSPVTTEYVFPYRKVLFCPPRDANPFFHLHEALWMLGGRNDVASVARYVKRMREFSDDGTTLQGAYGYRWRNHFGHDQLDTIVDALRDNPDDRRCVLSMWDGSRDLGRKSKDLPCNTQAYFSVNGVGELDMTICNRSNDIIWGAYGANLVHMSFLLEYMAARLERKVGTYYQISNNFHAYANVFDPLKEKLRDWHPQSPSTYPITMPLMNTDDATWRWCLAKYLDTPDCHAFDDPFFEHVAVPMREMHHDYKAGDVEGAMHWWARIQADDWRKAAGAWVTRRAE